MSDHRDDPALPGVRVAGDDPGAMDAVLRDLQMVALKHPEAFRAALRALMTEGRRFAETPEGARWQRRLAHSTLLNRAALIWQNFAGGPDGEEARSMPSQLLDSFFRLAATPMRDRLLDRWLRGGLSR